MVVNNSNWLRRFVLFALANMMMGCVSTSKDKFIVPEGTTRGQVEKQMPKDYTHELCHFRAYSVNGITYYELEEKYVLKSGQAIGFTYSQGPFDRSYGPNKIQPLKIGSDTSRATSNTLDWKFERVPGAAYTKSPDKLSKTGITPYRSDGVICREMSIQNKNLNHWDAKSRKLIENLFFEPISLEEMNRR